MTTLTSADLRLIRNWAERKANANDIPIDWVKGAINDAAQAIENEISDPAFRSQISTAINTSTGPYGMTFSPQEKEWLFAFVCELVYRRDG
jgi:hypothetical protein